MGHIFKKKKLTRELESQRLQISWLFSRKKIRVFSSVLFFPLPRLHNHSLFLRCLQDISPLNSIWPCHLSSTSSPYIVIYTFAGFTCFNPEDLRVCIVWTKRFAPSFLPSLFLLWSAPFFLGRCWIVRLQILAARKRKLKTRLSTRKEAKKKRGRATNLGRR